MKKYCEECGREVDTRILIKRESYIVCNETIEVDAQILTCAECGEEFYCEELDNATLVTAYNEYRRKHKLLLPEEIRKIREQYGLSQRSFAKLCPVEVTLILFSKSANRPPVFLPTLPKRNTLKACPICYQSLKSHVKNVLKLKVG